MIPNIIIDSDNPDIKMDIESIIEITTRLGAEYANGLTLHYSRARGFCIEAPSDLKQGEELVFMPASCLLPIDKFKFSLQGDNLNAIPVSQSLTSEQKELMKKIISFFNMTEKINYHKDTSPWSIAKDYPELFSQVLKGRSQCDLDERIKRIKKGYKEFLINDFLTSRTLGFKPDKSSPEKEKMMMPIIDFVNHHVEGSEFHILSEQERGMSGLLIRKSSPVPGSKESFTCYGPYDSYDTFLNYGFVATDVPFVRSVPLKIKLKGFGVLHVGTSTAVVKKEALPIELKELAFYLPRISRRKGGALALDVAPLYIPQLKNSDSLRKVLNIVVSFLLEESSRKIDNNERIALTNEIEKQLLQKNIKFYEDLKKVIKTSSVGDDFKNIKSMALQLVETQQERIKKYPFYSKCC